VVRSKRASLSRKPFNLNKIFQIKYEQGDDQKRDMNDFRIRRKPLGKGINILFHTFRLTIFRFLWGSKACKRLNKQLESCLEDL